MVKRIPNTYIIFIDLPTELVLAINDLREELFPGKKPKWQPHITIKYDEPLLIEEKELIKLVASYVKELKPISIRLGNIKINKSSLGINVYIPAMPEQKMIGMVKDLSKRIEPYINKKASQAGKSTKWEQSPEFYPHISIKGAKDYNQAKEIRDNAQQKYLDVPKEFILESITLAKWDKDKWQKVETFKIAS